MTLLRNEKVGSTPVLPLTSAKKIVVAGPFADSLQAQMGGWTVGWQGIPDNVVSKVKDPTILAGLKAGAPQGTQILAASDDKDAVTKLGEADAAVVVVGEGPGAEGPNDKPVPALDAAQVRLVDSLVATKKPVIVVVVAGRPLVLGSAVRAPGLLMAYLPGSEGGTAVADVLFGRADPAGRLPFSWPRTVGDQPLFYQQLAGNSTDASSKFNPLFPLGASLSYNTYVVQAMKVAPVKVRAAGHLKVTVIVRNTGKTAGDHVIPVFVSQPINHGILVPPKRLVSFARVSLQPGEAKAVALDVPVARLAVTPGDINGAGAPKVLPGTYRLLTDNNKVANFTVVP